MCSALAAQQHYVWQGVMWHDAAWQGWTDDELEDDSDSEDKAEDDEHSEEESDYDEDLEVSMKASAHKQHSCHHLRRVSSPLSLHTSKCLPFGAPHAMQCRQ